MGKSKLQLWGSVNYGASTFFTVETAETELCLRVCFCSWPGLCPGCLAVRGGSSGLPSIPPLFQKAGFVEKFVSEWLVEGERV